MLELALERDDRVGIEQLAQLRVTQQLAQLRLIDRERLRAPIFFSVSTSAGMSK